MSVQLQLRRGTTGLHSTFTGAPGEITVDTTKNTAVVHDGVTAGGYALAKENNAQLTGVTTVFDLSITGEIQSDLIPDVDITRDLGSSTKRWKDLYLSGSSIYLDDKVISTNINGFDFGSSVLKVGDLEVTSTGIYLNGETLEADLTSIMDDVMPAISNVYDIGSSAYTWGEGYFGLAVNIGVSSFIDFEGSLVLTGAESLAVNGDLISNSLLLEELYISKNIITPLVTPLYGNPNLIVDGALDVQGAFLKLPETDRTITFPENGMVRIEKDAHTYEEVVLEKYTFGLISYVEEDFTGAENTGTPGNWTLVDPYGQTGSGEWNNAGAIIPLPFPIKLRSTDGVSFYDRTHSGAVIVAFRGMILFPSQNEFNYINSGYYYNLLSYWNGFGPYGSYDYSKFNLNWDNRNSNTYDPNIKPGVYWKTTGEVGSRKFMIRLELWNNQYDYSIGNYAWKLWKFDWVYYENSSTYEIKIPYNDQAIYNSDVNQFRYLPSDGSSQYFGNLLADYDSNYYLSGQEALGFTYSPGSSKTYTYNSNPKIYQNGSWDNLYTGSVKSDALVELTDSDLTIKGSSSYSYRNVIKLDANKISSDQCYIVTIWNLTALQYNNNWGTHVIDFDFVNLNLKPGQSKSFKFTIVPGPLGGGDIGYPGVFNDSKFYINGVYTSHSIAVNNQNSSGSYYQVYYDITITNLSGIKIGSTYAADIGEVYYIGGVGIQRY